MKRNALSFSCLVARIICVVCLSFSHEAAARSISNQAAQSVAMQRLMTQLASIDTSQEQKAGIAEQLVQLGPPAVSPLMRLLQESFQLNPQLYRAALQLERGGPSPRLDRARQTYVNNSVVIGVCIYALSQLGDRQALPLLKRLLAVKLGTSVEATAKTMLQQSIRMLESGSGKAGPSRAVNDELKELTTSLIASATPPAERERIIKRFIRIGQPSVRALSIIIDGYFETEGMAPLTSAQSQRHFDRLLLECVFALGEIGGPEALTVLQDLDRRTLGELSAVKAAIERVQAKSRAGRRPR